MSLRVHPDRLSSRWAAGAARASSRSSIWEGLGAKVLTLESPLHPLSLSQQCLPPPSLGMRPESATSYPLSSVLVPLPHSAVPPTSLPFLPPVCEIHHLCLWRWPRSSPSRCLVVLTQASPREPGLSAILPSFRPLPRSSPLSPSPCAAVPPPQPCPYPWPPLPSRPDSPTLAHGGSEGGARNWTHRDQGSMVRQEGQHEVCILRKGGPIQEMGNSACWLGYRETQQGAGNPPPHRHKLPKQVKKNSVKPLPNVTEHRSYRAGSCLWS